MKIVETSPDPEQIASRTELSQLLEEALLDLPEQYRIVMMLRDVEGLSIHIFMLLFVLQLVVSSERFQLQP